MNAFCPVCGTANPVAGAKVHCGSCGTSFDAPSAGAGAAPAPVAEAPRPLPETSAPARPVPAATSRGSGETNVLAIVSLVAGILCCVPFASLAAVITGIISLNQLKQNPAQKGKEMAIAGLILGGLSFVFSLLWVLANLFRGVAR